MNYWSSVWKNVLDTNGKILGGLDAAVVYDGECPFCSAYTRHLRLKEACGNVGLIDARDGGPIVEHLVANGYDLDDGMALVLKDQIYHGDRCIHVLSLMTSPSTIFNKLNAAIFRSSSVSAVLYPILKFARNLVLRLLGRTKIHQPVS